MVKFNVTGLLIPVFTPFTETGSVNLAIIPEYMSYLHKNGVEGLLVGGTSGESVTLSLEERQSVLKAWVEVAKPLGVKIISQVGGVPMPDVLKMAEYSEKLKVDAIMTLPELYYKPKNTEQIVNYLKIVSDAAPTLPLIYYHNLTVSGVQVDIPEFFKMATERIPNFKGIKGDIGVAVQLTDLGEDQRVLISNHILAPAILLGHDTSVPLVTNLFPTLVKNIITAVKTGEVEKARVLQDKLTNLFSIISSYGVFLPAMKAAMPVVSGIKVGPPRRPFEPIDSEKKTQLEKKLKELSNSGFF